MIQTLRQREDVVLYDKILSVPEEESRQVAVFLQQEYESEAASYPYNAPPYDAAAALWAATIVYLSAQLILYRAHGVTELAALLPAYAGGQTPSAILSADLCLRFVPAMLIQLQLLDPDDALIPILQGFIQQWHYSGLAHLKDAANLNFEVVTADPCLHQLYADRIVAHRKSAWAKHVDFQQLISANLGAHASAYWPEFSLTKNNQ
ncbi:MAG: hypothetical protein EOO06_00190 [Chitinophagaceae bacterium]|nr:MAG: hypothetical protein EOO06_00190 [Chitinophagaceae bacterium]